MQFKTLFKENNSIQLLIAPSTGKIEDANQGACKFYGYSHKEITTLKKLNTLIVEDDATSAEFLSVILQNLKHELIHVSTGKEAIVACQQNLDFDLILMDIRMPEMNGYEATREIRKFNKEVVIIAQTAFALEGDKEAALTAGFNDYISKPINKNILASIIQKHCTRNKKEPIK